MKGYWNRPEATDSAMHDGWFRTGDMARRDEDGYYFIVDRKKDLIIRGGFNVYPREIEEVLYEHPVAAAAVIGVPHPTHGEEVAAAVQLLPGPVSRLKSCASTPKSGWLPTSIPGMFGSSTRCRWGRPERSSNGRSSRRRSWVGVDDGRDRSGGGRARSSAATQRWATSTTDPAPAPSRSTCSPGDAALAAHRRFIPAWPVSSSALVGTQATRTAAPWLGAGGGARPDRGGDVTGPAVAPGSTVRGSRLEGKPAVAALPRHISRVRRPRRSSTMRISTGRPPSGSNSSRRTSSTPCRRPTPHRTNPQALKAGVDTAGLNFLRGAANFISDMSAPPRIPSMVDRTPYRLGENIAATPGAVVLRTEMFELIQYRPQTPTVLSRPLLVIPPMINKFYVMDLAPGAAWPSTSYSTASRSSCLLAQPGRPTPRLGVRQLRPGDLGRTGRRPAGDWRGTRCAVRRVLRGHRVVHDRRPPGRHRRLHPVGRVDARRHGARPVACRAGGCDRGSAYRRRGGRRFGLGRATWTAAPWPRCLPGCVRVTWSGTTG